MSAQTLNHRGNPAIPNSIHAATWGILLVVILVLAAVNLHYAGRNIWDGWTEGAELRHPGYAERIHAADFFRTQANTWSNLAYTAVGLYAFGLGFLDLRRKPGPGEGYLLATPAMSFLFGAGCCYLGFASGFYHASLTRIGQQLDVAGMYSPLLALIAINLGRWLERFKITSTDKGFPAWIILTVLALICNYLLFRYKWSMSSTRVLSSLILTVTAFALLDRFWKGRCLPVPWMLLSGAAVVSARICWELDVHRKFSGPDAWYQGHSVWHLLTALSLFSIYFYYRLEVRTKPS